MLLAYAKLSLYDDLLESTVPDDPYLGRELGRYFPKAIAERISRRARASPAAPRNHRHPARQLDDQSRRPVADRAHRRPDRRRAGRDRRRLRRGARQLRHDRAQRRDRRARQQDSRQAAARRFMRRCRTCCSTASSGSCAMSIWRGALPTSSTHYRDGIAEVEAALDTALPEEPLQRARGAAATSLRKPACRRSWRAASPICRPLAAAPDIVSGRRPHRQAGGGCGRDLFRRGRVLPARPHRQRGAATSRSRIISTAWRSTARAIRSATPNAA